MKKYKLQVQEDEAHPEIWHDVLNDIGGPLTYYDEASARAALEQKYPILVKMERYAAGPKRTRVLIVAPYEDVDRERDE